MGAFFIYSGTLLLDYIDLKLNFRYKVLCTAVNTIFTELHVGGS